MNNTQTTIEQKIKEKALELGFDACGIARATSVSAEHKAQLRAWLEDGYAAGMQYMHNHEDKRTDPTLLVEGAKSVICVALNYFPSTFRKPHDPYFSYYAYGEDYHDVMKHKLRELAAYINDNICPIQGRQFTDSAPVLERYWAQQAGIGFIGKNTQLIIPGKGSYFFLGELIIDLELTPDEPMSNKCGTCTNCLTHCPSKALVYPKGLNANSCISYQTIENREDFISEPALSVIGNQVYGCDICQQVCPHNRYAKGNTTPELQPSEAFLNLDKQALENLKIDEFRLIFKKSAIKRAKYEGLRRNIAVLNNESLSTLSNQE